MSLCGIYLKLTLSLSLSRDRSKSYVIVDDSGFRWWIWAQFSFQLFFRNVSFLSITLGYGEWKYEESIDRSYSACINLGEDGIIVKALKQRSI